MFGAAPCKSTPESKSEGRQARRSPRRITENNQAYLKIMLRSIKQLYGDKLGASDGELGHVKDFYFDDQKWAVRYLVVDTGSWLTGRQVLIAPHAFGNLRQTGKILLVNLTRKQIEKSPSIESHKPVSRQFEDEYYRYYGWPSYWQGDALWGAGGFPGLSRPASLLPGEDSTASVLPQTPADIHLRSAQAVSGYLVKASDGLVGQVCDFMVDDKNWAIHHLVVKIGHRFSGKEAPVLASKVMRISYEESTVFVSLTKKAVEQNPADCLAPVGVAD